ncbi:MAG: hypothetical protein Q8M76_02295 [Spirochaetaceae bacterium]|nr:hypothetical protein [Spirochaetaceae bacterium]
MRTTVTIADDVYKAARSLAAARNLALGEVLSELARRGLRQPEASREEDGLPVFAVAESAPLFGTEEVAADEDSP